MNFSDDLQSRWWKLEEKLMERFGKKPDVESVLFMIGIQELGERLGCNSILIDVPVSPEDIPAAPDLGRIVDSSFSPSAVTFLRRSPPKGDPLRAG